MFFVFVCLLCVFGCNLVMFCLTDLLHTLSSIPRHLNFIEHTSDIGWKEYVDDSYVLLLYFNVI